jgi:hypothetical protein
MQCYFRATAEGTVAKRDNAASVEANGSRTGGFSGVALFSGQDYASGMEWM